MNHDAQDLRAEADAIVVGTVKRAGDELLRMNKRLTVLDAQIKKVKTELVRTLKTTTSISETISEKSRAGEPFSVLAQLLETWTTEQCERAVYLATRSVERSCLTQEMLNYSRTVNSLQLQLCHIDPLRTLDGDAWMSDDCPKRASLEIWAKTDVFGDLKRSLEKTMGRSRDLTIALVLEEGLKAQVRELNKLAFGV